MSEVSWGYPVALCAAYWVALLGFGRTGSANRHALRFQGGLGLAALAAHGVWAALHAEAVLERADLVLDLSSGFTTLGLPLGLLASTTGLRGVACRRYLDDAFRALPAALGMAKLGCAWRGCCSGGPFVPGPLPLYECAALLLLSRLGRRSRWEPGRLACAVVGGVAMIRLVVEPVRAASGPDSGLAAVWLALGWIGVATVQGLRMRSAPGRAEDARPGYRSGDAVPELSARQSGGRAFLQRLRSCDGPGLRRLWSGEPLRLRVLQRLRAATRGSARSGSAGRPGA